VKRSFQKPWHDVKQRNIEAIFDCLKSWGKELKKAGLMIDKKTIVFAAIIFIAIIAAAALFNAAGLSIAQILDIKNLKTTISKFLSPEFIGFLIIAPLAYAFAIIAMRKNESMQTLAICSAASAAGTIASLAVFPNLAYYLIIAIFAIISIPIAMYYSTISFREMKKFIVFRGTNSAIHKGALLIAIGIIIFSATAIMPKTQQTATEFEYNMIEFILGENTSGLAGFSGTGLSEKLADNLILQQSQLLSQMTANQVFENLKTKTDSDVIAFVTATEALKQQLASPVYRNQVIAQIKANQENALEQSGIDQTQIIQIIKKQMPIMQQFENWFWAIIALMLIGIIQLLFAIIIAPLGAAYTLILDRAMPENKKTDA
jgi:hypothetical protein